MRILTLTQNAVPSVKGEYEYNMCRQIQDSGIEIHSLTIFGDNSHYCDYARVVKRPLGFLPKRVGEIFSPGIINEIKKSFDIIHLHGPFWSFIPLQVIIWKKILKIKTPLIFNTHAYIPEKQMRFWKAVKKAVIKRDPSLIFYGLRCLPYTKVDRILCQSEMERKFVINEFQIDPGKVVMIPNGVDMKRYEIPTYDFKKRHSLKRKFLVLYVGQLIKMKGITFLLKAIKILKNRGLDCDLALVSYNPHEDVISEAESLGIKDNVKIFALLPEEGLISAYKSCDLFVLPSLSEGMPTVLIEAMAAKKLVISTNVSGVPHLLKDGFNGLMVKPRDSIALAGKMEKILRDEKLREKISINGFQTVKERYSWPVVAKLIIQQYKRFKPILENSK